VIDMSVIALNLTVLVLLAVTVFLLGGLVVTSRRLRRASRRVKAGELARQQFTTTRQAQDMALAVAERARANLQERVDRVPELERSIANLEEALKRAEEELRALRAEPRPRDAGTVQDRDARYADASPDGYAELRELILTLASDQRQLHAETANLVRVFASHFAAMGRALAEKDTEDPK
jgi:chromosome segregation ATPase